MTASGIVTVLAYSNHTKIARAVNPDNQKTFSAIAALHQILSKLGTLSTGTEFAQNLPGVIRRNTKTEAGPFKWAPHHNPTSLTINHLTCNVLFCI